jgi:hypothetical protein
MPNDAFGAGIAFRNYLSREAGPAFNEAVNSLVPANRLAEVVRPMMRDFIVGAATGERPATPLGEARQGAVTVALPALRQPIAKGQGARASQQPNRQGQTDPRAPTGAPSFDQMIEAWAAANGGKISLNEIGRLADVANKTATRQRQPSAADVAGEQALTFGSQLYRGKLEQSQKANDRNAYLKNSLDYLDFLERVSRSRAPDPLQGYYGGEQP